MKSSILRAAAACLVFGTLSAGAAGCSRVDRAHKATTTPWLGFTIESATTAAKFITTGTLDKFPKLDGIKKATIVEDK